MEQTKKQTKKPNVILLLTDDQGYGDLSVNGNPWLETPNYDMLCKTGVSLEDFHTDPLCAPTRAALLSGRYSFGAGVYSTLNGRYYMKPELVTIADGFKSGGYATGMFGKWHLGDTYPYHPHNRGFDMALSFGGGVIGETPDYWNNDYFDDTYTVNGEEKKFSGYCTDNFFNAAIDFIDEQKNSDKPFFCFLPTNAPHTPLNVDYKYVQKYLNKGVPMRRARYFGMIECIDENIGKLVAHLKEIGEYENTVIIYFGDNGATVGCELDENDFLKDGYNAGMRGKKGSVYEGAHKNACFLSAPSGIFGKPRKVYGLTSHFDLFPTCMEMCGIEIPKGLDGVSIYSDLAKDETHINKGRTIVVHNMQRDMPQKYKDYTVLRENMRLVCPLTEKNNRIPIKNFARIETVPPEMYDLEKDYGQTCDVYDNNKDLADELTRFYEDWYDERVDEAIKYSPIYITKENPVKITCHAWHEATKMCFNQNDIRRGVFDNGFWALNVVDEGEYDIELCRYPKESGLHLSDSCEEIPETKNSEPRPKGLPLDIVAANITVQGKAYSCAISEDEKSASVKIYLEKGEYNLRTKFILADKTTIGAYYCYISYFKTTL